MITNNKNILSLFSVILLVGLIFSSCDNEDYTGYSTVEPVDGVTLSVTPSFTSSVTMVEKDSTFEYTLQLSQAQAVDVKVFAYVTAGTATVGEDFSYTDNITIPAGKTSGKGKITVLSDDLEEEIETFTIQIGDQTVANVTYTPVIFDFTIQNYTTDGLTIDMSWTTDVFDVVGIDLDPEETCDLRMLILDATDNSVVEIIDGGSFENYSGMDTLPNGEYLIAVDFYSSIDAGDFDGLLTLGLELDFYQIGVINHTLLTFDDVMTDFYLCDMYYTVLASVTKADGNYTLEEVGTPAYPDFVDIVGDWNGTDAETIYTTGASQVVTEIISTGELQITGLGFEWMEDFWGEEIIDGGSIVLVVNYCDNTVLIPEQYYMTTLYKGDETDYNISGSGTVDFSGAYPTLTIQYDMDGWGEWTFDNEYGGVGPYFLADLTLDPAGKNVINVGTKKFDLSKKPVH